MSTPTDLNELTLGEELKYKGRAFRVVQYRMRMPDGRESLRDVVECPNAVAVVAVDDDARVVMVRQFRRSADSVLLELPAGKIEPGEKPSDAARRELEEETGCIARDMRYLFGGRVSPGYSTEIVHIFLATGLATGRPHPDENEFLHVERIPLAELIERVMDGDIDDGKTIAGILAAARILDADKER